MKSQITHPTTYAVGLLVLGNITHNPAIPANNPTNTGCSTPTPLLAAIAPVINGNAADPACPIVAEKPTAAVCSSLGSSFVSTEIPVGNSGPSRKPSKLIITALVIRLGTNQKISCTTTLSST